MKLTKLYSNKPDVFGPIDFVDGLNVVLAEIRLPENKDKDTHNLGKTTLGRMVDFCFLAGREANFFLFKYPKLFADFIFFLEIQLENGSYLTIRRGVEESSKISFKKHEESHQNFVDLPETSWNHWEMPFERASEMLDSLLDWRALKPWSYRMGLGYLLRSQNDFSDVFQLNKFRSAHADWKPFLAHILGFNAELLVQHYGKENAVKEREEIELTIQRELGGSIEDVSKVEGILLLKQKEVEKKQELLDAFDFRAQDTERLKIVVTDIDERIATLNSTRYSLSQSKRKILASLEEDKILFNPDDAQKLFEEAGIYFDGQIKRDFKQLIDFNRAITDERRGYLNEERAETENELKRVTSELSVLGKRRSQALSFLSGTDVFVKYKKIADELVILKADITSLERQRSFLTRLKDIRTEIRALKDEQRQLQRQIESDIEKQNSTNTSLFSSIRIFFSNIVEEVIDRKALLSVTPNKYGHLEFKAEILDETGSTTSADMGYTYRKLLCIAFDMAVLRAHVGEKFPRFVYHDGVFESLDKRKRDNLLSVIRNYSEQGIQPIITLIDSDLPPSATIDGAAFNSGEVILTLHDESEAGRLFRMRSW